MDLTNAKWLKSSHSGSNAAECVELADLAGMVAGAGAGVAVRDSKDPDGPVLLLTRTALRTAVHSTPGTH
ncbi:DUF397 domain-containing protein [Actinomadura sp. GC306]|uniref:DUF397 domain-containing protein n=1 Tax=Actinomadura sp. GC306 TaxID=2530367 RepID=UPI001053A8F8|nr:DUF397 domain-containing protein [Actinomadura sp. GC306]TDC69817.1 DUF397 domain-containing protein [Actinomadura sp. GC306]